VGKSERQRQLGRSKGLSVCGRIILNWILNRMGSKEGEMRGCRGHGTDSISDVNSWKIFD